MYLVKLRSGHFAPYDTADHDLSAKIPEGDVVKAAKSRNYKFHKKAFALLNIGFENQNRYEQFEIYRKVIIMRAGYYTMIKDLNNELHPLPDSLAFDKMGAEKFDKWYNDALEVISKDLATAPDIINAEISQFF